MKHFPILIIAFSILFSACSEKKQSVVVQPTPATPIVGGDADAHGCKASAGYQWSSLQKNCVRSFELPLQLLNADKTSGAGVTFSVDKKQAEVFSAMGTVVLSAQSAQLFSGKSGGQEWYLEQKAGKWLFGKKGEAAPSYREQ